MEVLEKIYLYYSSMVYNVALNYAQNIQDAEEITQGIYLKVYNKKGGFKNNSSIITWV